VLPTASFIAFIRRTYSDDAADAVLKELAEAQDGFDLEALLTDRVGPQRTRSLHLLILEPDRPRIRLETLSPGRYEIGRLVSSPSIAVRDINASRLHCILVVHGDMSVTVCDVGSANGTYINGQRIPVNVDSPLRAEDQILIGRSALNLIHA